jgi:hypothetical protein
MLKPTQIKDFPGRAVDQHLKITGALPDEMCQCPTCGRMHRHLGSPPWRDAMQPHQQRVVDEKKELDDKLDKLKAFIETSPVFKSLHADERGRLGRQFDVMAEYSSILSQRIAAFPA